MNLRYAPTLLASLIVAAAGHGQTASSAYIATITSSEVEVRSGPTDRYGATGRLVSGMAVTVLHESKEYPGWVAIKPPADAFSLIESSAVKIVDRIGFVDIDPRKEVSVFAGSNTSAEPAREMKRVKAGYQVIVLGSVIKTNAGLFLPIAPVADEMRWIPQEATSSYGGSTQMVSQQLLLRYPLLREAENYLQAGDYPTAYRKFNDAAVFYNDSMVRGYVQRRLQQVSQPQSPWTATSGQWQQVQPSPWSPAQPQYAQPDPYGQGTFTGFNQAPAQPASQWVPFWGILERTTFHYENRPVFVLVNQAEKKTEYVIAGPSLSLDTLVGKTITLYGVYQVNPTSGQRFMVATQHALPPVKSDQPILPFP